MTLRSVYYTAAGCWMVIPAVLQTNSHQHRQNKLLAFICCTQQQDHPNLLQGMFNRKAWGEVLESVLKLCLRHSATWEVTTSERHQLWSHQDVGTVQSPKTPKLKLFFLKPFPQANINAPNNHPHQLTVKIRNYQPSTQQCNLLTAIGSSRQNPSCYKTSAGTNLANHTYI